MTRCECSEGYVVKALRWLREHVPGGWDTWERGAFDWTHYGLLRRCGLSHRAAFERLDEMWAERYPHLDSHGYPDNS